MPFENGNVQQLPLEVFASFLVLIQVQVTPGAGHAHARLVWPEVPWGTDKHVHHRLGRFLARRKVIQVRHVRDIEVLGSRALVGRDRVGWWYAVGDGQLR